MADAYATEIRIAYNYIVRQRDDWKAVAPKVGTIAGLIPHLQWRNNPKTSIALPPDEPIRETVRALRRPHQRSAPNQWLTEWEARQVTFLRPVLDMHQRISDWVEARAVEGWTAQNNISRVLAEIAAYYETNRDHARALEQTME